MAERSEREKMLAGELYLATDRELVAMRRKARRLTRLYNASTEEEILKRHELLLELFGSLGDGAEIEPPFYCDYGSHIHVGNNFYMNFGCVVLDVNVVRIGDNVMCGPYVQILTASHPIDPAARASGRELGLPIIIGNDVWVGAGAIIGAGVRIGDGTTIGAGSVVVRDIPSRVLAAGNPCRVIRSLEESV